MSSQDTSQQQQLPFVSSPLASGRKSDRQRPLSQSFSPKSPHRHIHLSLKQETAQLLQLPSPRSSLNQAQPQSAPLPPPPSTYSKQPSENGSNRKISYLTEFPSDQLIPDFAGNSGPARLNFYHERIHAQPPLPLVTREITSILDCQRKLTPLLSVATGSTKHSPLLPTLISALTRKSHGPLRGLAFREAGFRIYSSFDMNVPHKSGLC